MPRCYTVKTLTADYFDGTVSEGKIYTMVERGEIPHIKIGTRIIFHQDSLDLWMEQNTKGGQSWDVKSVAGCERN
ncbi:MAG: helix-turn-helix domain-containing protein [Ignavibacteriales bacterium]